MEMKNVYTGISILTRGIRGGKSPSQSVFQSSPFSSTPTFRESTLDRYRRQSLVSVDGRGGEEKHLPFRRGRRLLIPRHLYDKDRRFSIVNYMKRNHLYSNRWRPWYLRRSTQYCQKEKSTLPYFLLLPFNPIFYIFLPGYLKNPLLT